MQNLFNMFTYHSKATAISPITTCSLCRLKTFKYYISLRGLYNFKSLEYSGMLMDTCKFHGSCATTREKHLEIMNSGVSADRTVQKEKNGILSWNRARGLRGNFMVHFLLTEQAAVFLFFFQSAKKHKQFLIGR